MNNNTVIVDLEKYEALIRENEDLKQRNSFLASRSVEILDRINDLEQFAMENNYYSWSGGKKPEDHFNRYSEMLDLGITRDVMKRFIEMKQAQKETEDE